MIYTVIAVHDRKHFTERCLKALQQQTIKDIQVVIIDDGSTDGTAEMVKRIYPTAKIIRSDGNWWWTGSMRHGIDYVLSVAKPNDFVLCANNDQIAEPNALEILLNTSINNHRAIVGSASRKLDHKNHIYDSAYTINWSTFKYIPIPVLKHGYYSGNIDVLTCRFTIVPIEFFKQNNFDDINFPHYFGDYDLFLQAKRLDYKLVLSYDAIIYDIGGISGLDRTTKQITLKQLYINMFYIRSHNNVIFSLRYYWKNCPKLFYKLKYSIALFCYYCYLFFKAIVFTLLKI
ncbi:MAG: glycosyltransferase family 2 protein [Patescibacteria group bacterium]|jgi:GT2 family glycosyltransferase